ncbi:unnamed protein product, partial [marine sediment metagenome]
ESIGDLNDVDLTDIANEKILQYNSTSGKWECETAPAGNGGYTNLTQFVNQTAWRVFYSDNLGYVIELPLGTDGQYLKSTGVTSAPIFDTPSGAGDMLKATYDTDADGDIDVASGGTEKSAWTLYAIPYLSGTTAFGEIPIGTAEYALTVNADATGYDFTLFDLSLYYLKTAIDTQGEVETLWDVTLATDIELAALTYSDVGAEQADAGLTSLAGLTYVSPSFIKVTATDTYAIRTIAEVITDLALDSDDLSDVASIAMLDENEAITGAWTVTGSIGGVDTTEFGYLAA